MELNAEAWTRWAAFRTAIKKPIKPASEEAMKLKLMRYGEDQDAVVEQSISNQWQGLFPVRPEPGEPKKRSGKQREADSAHFEVLMRESERNWNKVVGTPIGKLKLAWALLARYDAQLDQSSIALAEQREHIKGKCAELLRIADPAVARADYDIWRLVLRLYGDGGLRRLALRAREAAERAAA